MSIAVPQTLHNLGNYVCSRKGCVNKKRNGRCSRVTIRGIRQEGAFFKCVDFKAREKVR